MPLLRLKMIQMADLIKWCKGGWCKGTGNAWDKIIVETPLALHDVAFMGIYLNKGMSSLT
jgi:hypothetical protein